MLSHCFEDGRLSFENNAAPCAAFAIGHENFLFIGPEGTGWAVGFDPLPLIVLIEPIARILHPPASPPSQKTMDPKS
jgi:hypothetical protein